MPAQVGNVDGKVIRWDDDEFERHAAAIVDEDIPEDDDDKPSPALVDAVFFFRRILSVEDRPPIDKVVARPGVEIFAKLSGCPCKKVAFQALWALTNIASGDSSNTRAVIESGVVPHALKIMRDVDLIPEEALILRDPMDRIMLRTLTLRWGPTSGYAAGGAGAAAAAAIGEVAVGGAGGGEAEADADMDMEGEGEAGDAAAAAAAAAAVPVPAPAPGPAAALAGILAGGAAAPNARRRGPPAAIPLPSHGLFLCDRDDTPPPREEEDRVDHLDLVDQVAWLLGNMIGDSSAMRDALAGMRVSDAFAAVLEHVLAVLHENADRAHATKMLMVTSRRTTSLLRNIAWACSNIARGKPKASVASVRPLLPGMAALASCVDPDTAADAMWFWSYTSELDDEGFVMSAVTTPFVPLPITMTAAILDGKTGDELDAAAAAMRASPVNLLMITSFVLRQLANWPADSSGNIRFNGSLKALASACVRAVGNLVTGDGALTSLTYSSGAVVALLRVCMRSGVVGFWKEAMWTASNILADDAGLAAWLSVDPFFRRMLACILCPQLGAALAADPGSGVIPPSRGPIGPGGAGTPPKDILKEMGWCLCNLLGHYEADGPSSARWTSFSSFLCGTFFGAEVAPGAAAVAIMDAASTALIMQRGHDGAGDLRDLPGGSVAALSVALDTAGATIGVAAVKCVDGEERSGGSPALLDAAAGMAAKDAKGPAAERAALAYCPLAGAIFIDSQQLWPEITDPLDHKRIDIGKRLLKNAIPGASGIPVPEIADWVEELGEMQVLADQAKEAARARGGGGGDGGDDEDADPEAEDDDGN